MDPTSPGNFERKDKQELAFKLLIELLAYQLASPVRWIETQNQLLGGFSATSRFIEVGPRTTLATMAERSAARHYKLYAPSQWSDLQFFSYQDNQDDIFYLYPEASSSSHDARKSSSLASTFSSSLVSPPVILREPEQSNPSKAYGMRASPSIDVSLSAGHVALVMTAQKLRRPFDQVPMNKTIRELSGGKSTLQNEIVGDLVAEFGKVPEGVEDMALAALGDALQSGFCGKPAKSMATLIARFISSKMPAGFNQASMQDYLQCRWGFTKSHTIIPLCLATTIEPAARLPKASAARLYLDELVNRYTAFQGISLIPVADSDNTPNAGYPSVVDSSKLESYDKEQRVYYRKQFDILAKYLQIEINGSEKPTVDAVDQERLDRWDTEFDDQFLHGTKPIFDPDQARHYDSWWNWAREELIQWSHKLFPNPTNAALPSHLRRMLNRWEPSCSDIVESMLETSRSLQFPDQILSPASNFRLVLNEALRLGKLALASDPLYIYSHPPLSPKTILTDSGQLEYVEVPRAVSFYPDVVRQGRVCPEDCKTIIPFVHLKSRKGESDWRYDAKVTSIFQTVLEFGANTGYTFIGKAVLITGAGPGSIAAEVIKGLLSGGACVVVATSRAVCDSATFYQQMYRRYGARGASLTVFPMNQGSKQDCVALIEHLYGAQSPTGGDLDYLIPFAAIPQAGEVDTLGTRQELALRTMLVNLLRLIGCVRQAKEKRRINCRPTMALLPMSCNEGTFGGDGLYAESKIGLKTLFNRFHSESWSTYITICGAVIGWTRGTGLMRSSNTVAQEVEKLGVVTFTQAEMAFNILALMRPEITTLAEEGPVYADLTGGLGSMWNIKGRISASRERLAEEVQMRKALAEEDANHRAVLHGERQHEEINEINISKRRARLNLHFPSLEGYADFTERLPNLRGMIDPSRTVVVVGFSELGPWGNSRTRWEMEHQGSFTLEGYIEMAWMMGLIRYVDSEYKGRPHVGWVDTETQEPIHDHDVPQRYHDRIMSGTGLRFIEPKGVDAYVPSQKEFLQEVAVEEDLPPFECSKATAEAFKLRHGENVTLQPIPTSDNYLVCLKKGAVLMIAKTIPFHQSVAGPIPTGWDPSHYGIPEEVIQQVDATTLYALVCVSEAFLSAGIKDPYEIYQHIHVSELANCLGTGGGPLKIIQNMYRDRFLDRPIRGDIILEHFLNTMGAWVNMLLLSAAGPLKTPVGACATALESLDIGCDAIYSGNCKVAIVGGCDDYREELSYEFASIKATANCADEAARGRLPGEMSRPTASSRSGFVESAGCGVQILMTAELALELGLPIHGIVAYSQMASDQIGRSIPAPGKGILTAARETLEAKNSPFLDLDFRRAGFNEEKTGIQQKSVSGSHGRMEISDETQGAVKQSTQLRIRDAQWRWAHNIRLQDPAISPLRAALATWGLVVDDIGVVSMHGTSTKANDVNEGEVINAQMEHLGRRKGNPLLSVCQKSLTGHPKAAAVSEPASHPVVDKGEGATESLHVEKMLVETTERSKAMPSTSMGVDVEEVTSINLENETFLQRNFTPAEREYCLKAPDARASFAGRWSAKEAVFKSLQTSSRGTGAAMDEIEVLNEGGIPKIFLHGHAKEIAQAKGIENIEVTISHTAKTAVAIAVAIGALPSHGSAGK
ncbi:hypothetical protein BBP40_002043 [Aspergillus hancockii]|nr:hypothetical protein BBP40_002043 [Aspergillus hancockii]